MEEDGKCGKKEVDPYPIRGGRDFRYSIPVVYI
jgi:hypothetical protein